MDYIFSRRNPEVGDKGFIIGNRFIPINNNLKIPKEGLIFYSSFKSDKSNAETGEQLIKAGTVFYEKSDNIRCARFNESYINSTVNFPKNGLPFTISFWFKLEEVGTEKNEAIAVIDIGTYVLRWRCPISIDCNNKIMTLRCGKSYPAQEYASYIYDQSFYNHWMNLVMVYSDGVVLVYKNATKIAQNNLTLSVTENNPPIIIGGCGYDIYVNNFNTWISGLRIYDRVLDEKEIFYLYQEFKI